jgi:hypothetical protein
MVFSFFRIMQDSDKGLGLKIKKAAGLSACGFVLINLNAGQADPYNNNILNKNRICLSS